MDPIREQIDVMTRRHFFGRAGVSLGTAALAGLLAEGRPASAADRPVDRGDGRRPAGGLPGLAAFRPQGQAGHLPVHERRPVADGPVGLQARRWSAMFDKDLPDSIRMGQRLTTMTSGQARFPVAPSKYQVRPARPGGDVGQRAPALDGQDRRRHRAGQVGLDRGDQPRPGGHLYLHGEPAPGPAQPGLVAELRAGHDEPRPAGVRGDDGDLDRPQGGAGDLQPALGLGLSAQPAPGRGAALQRRPGALPVEPRGGRRRHAAPVARRARPAQPGGVPPVRRPRDPGPDRPVRDGVPDADLGPRAGGHLRRAEARARHVRARRAHAGDLRAMRTAGPPA